MTIRIFAVDPANVLGYADTLGFSGTVDFRPKRNESKGLRLLKIRRWLDERHGEVTPIELLVFEEVRCSRNIQAMINQGEIQGVIIAWCEERGVEYKGYTSSQIKKHATGKGNAPKEQMVAAAEEYFDDLTIVDDNHADALWCLDLAKQEFETETPFE